MHHFAHRPGSDCPAGASEGWAHELAKRHIAQAWGMRPGTSAEIEAIVPSLAGDRRADVLLTSPRGQRVAIEVQVSNLSFEATQIRTRAYQRARIPVIWLGLLTKKDIGAMERLREGDLIISAYSPKQWQRYAHALNNREIWLFEPEYKQLYRAVFEDYYIHVPEFEGHGGYDRFSKRWKNLHLDGPYEAADLSIHLGRRSRWEGKTYTLYAGDIATFKPNDEN